MRKNWGGQRGGIVSSIAATHPLQFSMLLSWGWHTETQREQKDPEHSWDPNLADCRSQGCANDGHETTRTVSYCHNPKDTGSRGTEPRLKSKPVCPQSSPM